MSKPASASRYWQAVSVVGVCGMVAALIPGLRLGISVSRGGGDAQVSYMVWRDINFAWGAPPLSSLYLVGAAVIALGGVLGLLVRQRAVRAGVMLVVFALTATAAVHMGTLWDQPPPQWPVPHSGSGGCQITAPYGPETEFAPGHRRCGGALLAASIEDILVDTGRAHPELDFAMPYRLEPLVGAWVLWLAAVGLLWWTLIRAAGLGRWIPHLPVVATVMLVAALVGVAEFAFEAAVITGQAENCAGSDSWACSEFLGGVLPWVFLFASASALTLVVAKATHLARTRAPATVSRRT